ncbi:hypothetical protein POM88_001594 [Heracleum sosnowskyi]|uniref:ABC transmembrane type-1 domain-containing protein n=1 Tax=Heracleum sosnowskyi TaxID=360622 RepID=A0AAD8N9R7_9APIA|nr:hypothetical protein POM88_001594 [Heracleum sosnowskyi]
MNHHSLARVSVKYVYLALGSGIAAFSQVACWNITEEIQAAQIRYLYLKAILRQDVAFFDIGTRTGEVVDRLSADIVIIQGVLTEKNRTIDADTGATAVAGDDVALVTEDWRLNQFWYDRETTETVAKEVHALCSSIESPSVALLDFNNELIYYEGAEKVVGWALRHHLMQNSKAEPDARLVLSGDSIHYGIGILQSIQSIQNESKNLKKSLKDVVTENEFEKKLLAEVIPPNDIGVC